MTVDPEAAEGVNTHPAAVPRLEKSEPEIPDTDSLKVNPNVSDIAAAGEDGDDDTEAVGGVWSTATDDATTAASGIVVAPAVQVTELAPSDIVTVPSPFPVCVRFSV